MFIVFCVRLKSVVYRNCVYLRVYFNIVYVIFCIIYVKRGFGININKLY